MRSKHCFMVLGCVVLTSLLLLIFGSTNGQRGNDRFNMLVSQTHQQLQEFQENLIATSDRKLSISPKYLDLLGFTHPIYNGTRYNFTIVTYVFDGMAPSAILLSQNIAQQLPNTDVMLLIYDLGLTADDARQLSAYCNNSHCAVITYDLTPFPSYVADEHMHAYRPLIIKDALCRSHAILFLESRMRLRLDAKNVYAQLMHGANASGILGWTTKLQAVSSLTHPKMFKYFETDVESFQFLQMVSMSMVVFVDTPTVNEKILLPWVKCSLTMECIHPLGAQSGGCRYNKKPMYRYSGCHGYDASAFNILLGLQWQFNASKYSTNDDGKLFYSESPEEATRQLENRRKNISDTLPLGYGSEQTPIFNP